MSQAFQIPYFYYGGFWEIVGQFSRAQSTEPGYQLGCVLRLVSFRAAWTASISRGMPILLKSASASPNLSRSFWKSACFRASSPHVQ